MKKLSVLWMIGLVTALLPVGPAQAATQIRFLNPSNYSAGNTTEVVSVSPDEDSKYHFVSWVQEVPPSPQVDFEIKSGTLNPYTIEGADVIQASTDTWEAKVTLPSTALVPNGAATLETRLYSGNEQVAVDTQSVTISRTLPTVEITYPVNGGNVGYTKQKNGFHSFLVRGIVSENTTPGYARVYYTLSAPGQIPIWRACGAAAFNQPGTDVPTAFTHRCQLATGHDPADLSGVAAVANTTSPPAPPTDPPQPNTDASGDAHRMHPYLQEATSVSIGTPALNNVTIGDCATLVATVRDQLDEVIAGTDVDAEAQGPSDQLRFGSVTNTTTSFKKPDKNHLASESAYNCNQEANGGEQGDHNVPGGDDFKHIEAVDGTSNSGGFTFAQWSDEGGPTVGNVWADTNDDDLQQTSEPSAGYRIGWGQPAPPPEELLLLSPASSNETEGTCVLYEVQYKVGGSPQPDRNIDVHASGPTANVNFCDPAGASPRSDPTLGDHTGNTHTSTGEKHTEGTTNSTGRFLFGVTSPDAGTTSLLAWIDNPGGGIDDDVFTGVGEQSDSATATWSEALTGNRSISLNRSRTRVRVGRRVTLSGAVNGETECEGGQLVRLSARRKGTSTFRNIASKTTAADGRYSFSVVMRRARYFRTSVRQNGICKPATSRTLLVRINRG